MQKKAFTLLELLLSISIIVILAGFSLPIYKNLLMKNDLDIAVNIVNASLHRAQILAQSVDSDTTWGLKAQNTSIVIFKGINYASRDAAFDEIFDTSSTISISGLNEIVFTKLSGSPVSTGTINLSTVSDSRTVSINEKGIVDY